MKAKRISWRVSKANRALVLHIVERAARTWPRHALPARKGGGTVTFENRKKNLQMDLEAVHANGNPMDFSALLDADEEQFNHDLEGITQYLDRDTGRLSDFFVPRFSSPAPRTKVERVLARADAAYAAKKTTRKRKVDRVR